MPVVQRINGNATVISAGQAQRAVTAPLAIRQLLDLPIMVAAQHPQIAQHIRRRGVIAARARAPVIHREAGGAATPRHGAAATKARKGQLPQRFPVCAPVVGVSRQCGPQ